MVKRSLLFCCDLAVVGVATLLAALLRENFALSLDAISALQPYMATSVLIGAALLMIFALQRRIWRLSTFRDYLRICFMCFVLVALTVSVSFLGNRLQNIPRALPVLQLFLMIAGLVGLRVAARLLFAWFHSSTVSAVARRETAAGCPTVILVGFNRFTALYIRSVEDLAPTEVRIAGIAATQADGRGQSIENYPVLGSLREISRTISQLADNGVRVTHLCLMVRPAELGGDELDVLAAAAQGHGLKIEVFPEKLFGAWHGLEASDRAQGQRPHAPEAQSSDAHHAPVAHWSYWKLKRAIDLIGSVALICLFVPVFLLLGLIVALDVGVPVIFWQERPGAKGQPFKVFKFRTMRTALDASGRRRADEERLSAVGRTLRRFRLDELPQLFNVLFGEMSFVGPRPLLPADQYPGLEARMAIAPGITGWAQVNGGREISAADKAALDIWYIQNACLRIDIQILFATCRMVIKGETRNSRAIDQAWMSLGAQSSLEGAAQNAMISPIQAVG